VSIAEHPFSRLVSALEPWLRDIVILGGWAHHLYRRHPNAQQLDYPPLTTVDTDVALPRNLSAHKPDIRARLLARGFTEEFLGHDRPPATHYRLAEESSGFYAEFLTPLTGGEFSRAGNRKSTIEISGVVSQQLRHIDVLLRDPWAIDYPLDGATAKINIANPVAFLAQKVLIHGRRGREDRSKDILYMHDTIDVYGSRLPQLSELWRDSTAPQLHRRDAPKVALAAEAVFGEITDDIRRAAQIPAERRLTPGALRDLCNYGFREVSGRADSS
jgi:hypothetical protein